VSRIKSPTRPSTFPEPNRHENPSPLAFIGSILTAGAQTIESGNHPITGYVKADGPIEDSGHSTQGYIEEDGTIENASHSTIGCVKSDGTVEGPSHSTIGYAKGVPPEWAALVFFFFKFK
jgi:hypothetical protein